MEQQTSRYQEKQVLRDTPIRHRLRKGFSCGKKTQHEEFYFQQGRAIHTVYVSSCLCSALFCGDTEKGIKTGVFHEHSYLFTWISHHSLFLCLDVCVQRSRWVYATVWLDCDTDQHKISELWNMRSIEHARNCLLKAPNKKPQPRSLKGKPGSYTLLSKQPTR